MLSDMELQRYARHIVLHAIGGTGQMTLCQATVALVGVGGIDSAEAAWTKIRAGASLLQLYSSLVYAGPGLIPEIKAGLVSRMAAEGASRLAPLVGRDAAALAKLPG